MEQIASLDTKNWIVIPPEFDNRGYTTEISPERLSYNSAVEEVGEKMKLKLKNTSEDSLGRKFVGNISFMESLRLNLLLGVETPDLKEFIDYGKFLSEGMVKKTKVYDVSGKQVDSEFLEQVFKDIYAIQYPLREEYIDAVFGRGKDNLYIKSRHHLVANGRAFPKVKQTLENETLMNEDDESIKIHKISLWNYLNSNHTEQGLPSKKVTFGAFGYWAPVRKWDYSIVRFSADSEKASLICLDTPFQGYPAKKLKARGIYSMISNRNN